MKMCENECVGKCHCGTIGFFLLTMTLIIIAGAIITVCCGGKW